jgi:hypothetical protein
VIRAGPCPVRRYPPIGALGRRRRGPVDPGVGAVRYRAGCRDGSGGAGDGGTGGRVRGPGPVVAAGQPAVLGGLAPAALAGEPGGPGLRTTPAGPSSGCSRSRGSARPPPGWSWPAASTPPTCCPATNAGWTPRSPSGTVPAGPSPKSPRRGAPTAPGPPSTCARAARAAHARDRRPLGHPARSDTLSEHASNRRAALTADLRGLAIKSRQTGNRTDPGVLVKSSGSSTGPHVRVVNSSRGGTPVRYANPGVRRRRAPARARDQSP